MCAVGLQCTSCGSETELVDHKTSIRPAVNESRLCHPFAAHAKMISFVIAVQVVVSNYRADASYTGAESWLAWSGSWGNQKDACLLPNQEESCTLSDGPVGPQYQTSAA